MSENRQASCEERIESHMASRLADFAALNALIQSYDAETVIDALASYDEADEMIDGSMWADELRRALNARTDHGEESEQYGAALADVPERAADEIREAAMQRADEYPLHASRMIVHRVELSTGGPGDWLEVFCDADEPREILRVVYHFNDWFDHAERTLSGDEERAAADFASYVLALDA
jgi:2-phospho-L-lactate guanylyltransferase (CobY/MobA/RfbA family)